MARVYLWLLLCLVLLMAVACGRQGAGAEDPGSTRLKTFGGFELPAASSLQKATSSVGTPFALGKDYDTSLPRVNVNKKDNDALLSPDTIGNDVNHAWAYATYSLDMTTYDPESALHLTWAYLQVDATAPAWVGLVNFNADRWDFFKVAGDGSVEVRNAVGNIDFSPYINANHVMPVMVMAYDYGLRRLAQVCVSKDAPAWVGYIGGPRAVLGYSGESLTVDYQAQGTQPFTYAWDFGTAASPSTSTDAAPEIILGAPGDYTGQVTVSNGTGDPYNTSFLIRVAPQVNGWSHTWGTQYVDPNNIGLQQADAQDLATAGDSAVYQTVFSNWDTAVLKYSSGGQLLWSRGFTSNALSDGNGALVHLAVDQTGGIWSAGNVLVPTIPTGADSFDICLTRISTAGTLLLKRNWDVSYFDEPADIVAGADAVYVVTQTRPAQVSGPFHSEACVLKFDLHGNLLWCKSWGDGLACNPQSAALDSNGDLVVCGTHTDAQGIDSIMLLRVASDGKLLNSVVLADGWDCKAWSIKHISDGWLLGGHTEYTQNVPWTAMVLCLDEAFSQRWCTTWKGQPAFTSPYFGYGNHLETVGHDLVVDEPGDRIFLATDGHMTGSILLQLNLAGAVTGQKALTGQSEFEESRAIALLGSDVVISGEGVRAPLHWQPVTGQADTMTFTSVPLDLVEYPYVAQERLCTAQLRDFNGVQDEVFPAQYDGQDWRSFVARVTP